MSDSTQVRGMSKARREVLDLVRRWDKLDDRVVTPTSVARELGGTRQNASKLLQGLVAQGLCYKDGARGWRPSVDITAEAKRRGGSVGKAYSTLRLHAEALDAAILDADDREMKSLLREARNELWSAEQALSEALTLG